MPVQRQAGWTQLGQQPVPLRQWGNRPSETVAGPSDSKSRPSENGSRATVHAEQAGGKNKEERVCRLGRIPTCSARRSVPSVKPGGPSSDSASGRPEEVAAEYCGTLQCGFGVSSYTLEWWPWTGRTEYLSLLAYMDGIIRASQRFVWPSWVEYDTRFRQEAAGDEQRSWAVVDASLYTECFTGQSKRWAVEPTRAKGTEQDKVASSRKKPKLHWETQPQQMGAHQSRSA